MSALERDDAELVAAYADGDVAAMAELWARHQRFVAGVARHLLGRAAQDADDMVQEVAVKLLGSVHTWAGRASFRSWLYRMTSSVVTDHYRRRMRSPALSATEVTDALGHRVARDDHALAAVDHRSELADLLEVLPPCHLDAVMLVHHDGLSVSDAAAWLGVPQGTVKSRCFRGLSQLREAVAS